MGHIEFWGAGWRGKDINLRVLICQLLSMTIIMGVTLPNAPYNFTPSSVGFTYVAPLIGAIVGVILGGYACDKFIKRMNRCSGCTGKGVFEPEFRLLWLAPLYVFGPVGLLLFGFGFGHHWIVPTLGVGMSTIF